MEPDPTTDDATGLTVLRLSAEIIDALRAQLPRVAEETVAAVIARVPSYENAWSGPMNEAIRNAVELALGGFLTLAGRSGGPDPGIPAAPVAENAYALGRGEARAGRTMEALLAAYRIGARVSWRDMSRTGVAAGLSAEQLGAFAELVFAYIDELSATSAAGYTDELETSGRVRRRYLERLSRALLTAAPDDAIRAAAERADWTPPTALTAVLVPDRQVRAVLRKVDPRSLNPTEDVPGLDAAPGFVLLLVAEPGRPSPRARRQLLAQLDGHGAIVGPTRPWLEADTSYRRALRLLQATHAPRDASTTLDTEDHLVEILLGADADSLDDLRARVLAPLSELRPSAAQKLTETLRSWLLHQGRRDDVAADLFVHAQTVRYRMGQLRDAYGKQLQDPDFVLEATIALATASPRTA
jgi:hypothetical protein